MKWSPEYENAMYLVELWVLLKTQYEENQYSGQKITQIQQKLPQITSDVNEVSIIIGI